MTVNQAEETRAQVKKRVEKRDFALARWIQDPFASAYLATAATATAVGCVLTGMWLISVAIS